MKEEGKIYDIGLQKVVYDAHSFVSYSSNQSIEDVIWRTIIAMFKDVHTQIKVNLATKRAKRVNLEAQLPIERAQIIAQEFWLAIKNAKMYMLCRSTSKEKELVVE